ncbi:MAG TPA: ankyrin repeat domain-containing protein, partial [Gammaproteobacteria bacterium]|nr:ankyrin repeat domain-containing protein [Gammaproteobacteria bacterium]
GNWGILFDLFIENKIDLKNIDPKILESDLTTEAESRYPDIKFVNKLFSAYQFNNQALTSALSNIFYRQNYDMFLLLLDKIDLKNIDPSALKDIITSATQSSDFRFIRSLLTTCKFNEQILTQALNAASNIRYSSKNDRVLYLLGLLNENNIELKNIDFGVLNKIIITAVEYNDLDFIRSLLTACNFNEQILTKILNAASDIKHSGKNKMVPYLLDLINKNKIELKSIDSAILHKIFTNAVEDGSIELTNKLLEQYKFSDNFLHETLGKKLQSIPWGNKITEEIVLSILNAYEFKDSADFVRPSPYPLFHGSGNFNGSLLEFACCNKMENLALALLERKPDLNHNLRQTQKSALIYACENGLKEVVVKMIEQKAQLDQIVVDYEPVVGYTFVSREEVQKTPLIAALNSGHPDIALLLIQAGAKNFNVQWDKQSEQYYQFYWLPDNALDIAIKKGYIDVAKEIIKKAEEQGIKVYAKLRNFQHTVNITCQLGNLELIDLVINSNLYDNSLRLENIIEDIYDLLKSHPYTDNSERKANNVLTHLLERPFVCPEPLYEAVIKHLDAEILLKIFETRKEYAPDNDEKKVALLKQLDMSHNNMGWRGDKIRDTKYLTTILALLEKGYLDLNTIENSNYCTRMLGAHLKTTHLNSHPKLAMALAKHESFDQYLTPEVCERLITIRKSLPQEDIVHIHFQSHLEKERAKPKGNESQGDHSNTQKPD